MNTKHKYNFDTINIKKYAKLKLDIICDKYKVNRTDLINELLDNTFAINYAVAKINIRKNKMNNDMPLDRQGIITQQKMIKPSQIGHKV